MDNEISKVLGSDPDDDPSHPTIPFPFPKHPPHPHNTPTSYHTPYHYILTPSPSYPHFSSYPCPPHPSYFHPPSSIIYSPLTYHTPHSSYPHPPPSMIPSFPPSPHLTNDSQHLHSRYAIYLIYDKKGKIMKRKTNEKFGYS